MSVDIKKGGLYATRSGQKVGPMLINTGQYDVRFCWYAKAHTVGAPAWTGDGRYDPNSTAPNPFDIVSEWPAVEVTPAETLPVRTVTRHEIVPGVYGRLMVDRGLPAGGTVLLGVFDVPDTGHTHWTAAELRAAARVFVSLAEALEQD